jgi:cytoskeleton protein RodZ
MMNTQQDSQTSNMESNSVESLIVGKALREARERLGLSVNDVANRIKFAPRQIEWLEADDYVRLPEAAFVRGFVRSYARLVELDPAQLISGLPSSYVKTESVQDVKSVNVPMPTALSARRYNIILLATGLIIAVLVAIFERMNDRVPEQVESQTKTVVQQLELPVATADQSLELQAAASAPVVASSRQLATPQSESVVKTNPNAPAPIVKPVTIVAPKIVLPEAVVSPAPIKPQPTVSKEVKVPASSVATLPVAEKNLHTATDVAELHSLRLEFDEDAWIEVKDGTDKVLASRLHTAGSLMRVTVRSPGLVIIGNARAVRLFDNGKKVALERYTTAEVAKVKLQ